MKATMGKVAPKSVRPETTDSATTPAPEMGSYPAYLAGRGNTVKNRSVWRAAARGMETAPDLESVSAETVGRAPSVMNVRSTRPVSTVPASCRGNATARRAGEAYYVTKT